nr:hypothetical protein [Tanacetum cinerariifolium]
MQTRSSSKLSRDQTSNPTSSTNTTPKGRTRRSSKQKVQNSNLEEHLPPIATMADQRTMAQLLQAPTEGYEDTIVVPKITADNFELKHGLFTLVQNKQFYGHDKEDPHAHIRYFNKITATLKFPNVPNTSIKLMLFLFSLEGVGRIWLEKEPPRSILTWDDLVSKFINQFFPPSKTTNLHNEITSDCLSIVESKSKVCYSRDKTIAKVSMNTSTSGVSPDVVELKDLVRALLLEKKGQNQPPAPVKAVAESCVTCGVTYNQGNIGYRPQMMSNQIRPPGFPPVANNQNVPRNNQNRFILIQNQGTNFNQGLVYQPPIFQQPAYQAPTYRALTPQTHGVSKFVNSNTASTSSSGTLSSNTVANPKSDLKAITTRSGVSYDGPSIPPSMVEKVPEATKDTVILTNNGTTKDVQPHAVPSKSSVSTSPANTSVSASKPNPQASIPYPSRRNDERNQEKAKDQIEKFYQIFKDMSFKISFANALILMPKFASTLKALIGNKEKLSEMARTPLNEHLSAVLLKKLPEKLGDPELVDRSISRPVGVEEDVYVKVGSFHFQADFVVVDFDADPWKRILKKKTKTKLKTTKSNTEWKRSEKTKSFKAESQSPRSTKGNPEKVKVKPYKAEAEKIKKIQFKGLKLSSPKSCINQEYHKG